MMVYFHDDVHHLIDVERLDSTRDCRPHRVTDKITHVVVFQKGWILRKYRGFCPGSSISVRGPWWIPSRRA